MFICSHNPQILNKDSAIVCKLLEQAGQQNQAGDTALRILL